MNNRKDDAIKSLSLIYTETGIEFGLSRFSSICTIDSDSILLHSSELTYKEVVCTKKYRKMLRIAVVFSLIQQLSGINMIVLYSTSIFKEIGGSVFESRVLTFFMSLANISAGFIAIPILAWAGRKVLII